MFLMISATADLLVVKTVTRSSLVRMSHSSALILCFHPLPRSIIAAGAWIPSARPVPQLYLCETSRAPRGPGNDCTNRAGTAPRGRGDSPLLGPDRAGRLGLHRRLR